MRLLTTDQAAAIVGLSAATLEDWRWQKLGPPYIKISRSCVRYDEAALYAWLKTRTVYELPKASGE
jgi:predicted DNA-binding transcriptional regulator AlpA